MRRYIGFSAAAHLVWEIAHVPLYTIWATAGWREIAFDVLHCTGGDILIATMALVGALVLAGTHWPASSQTYARVRAIALAAGIFYTIYSEWLNVSVRKAWAYSELMPVVPVIGTGLTPLLQWIVVPLAAFWWARRSTP